MGFDSFSKIGLVLDNPSDDQTHPAQTSNLDGEINAFIWVDSAQENQVLAAGLLKRVQRKIDAVVDRRQIIQAGGSIRVANGNEVSVAILLIDRHNFGRRESMDSRQ